MIVLPPVCLRCRHYRLKSVPPACDAFDKIPAVIWIEGDPHTGPIPGDHGIRFEPKPADAPPDAR